MRIKIKLKEKAFNTSECKKCDFLKKADDGHYFCMFRICIKVDK